MNYFVAIFAIPLGVAGLVAGEADDSPGLQPRRAHRRRGCTGREDRPARRRYPPRTAAGVSPKKPTPLGPPTLLSGRWVEDLRDGDFVRSGRI